MKKMITKLLGFFFGYSIADLQEQSSDALKTFLKTIDDLKSVNVQLEKRVSSDKDKISEIQGNIIIMDAQKANNQKMVDKINNFLD
jgi:hypothetical protein